jgi:hypothetical protein
VDLRNVGHKSKGCTEKTFVELINPSPSVSVLGELAHFSNLNTWHDEYCVTVKRQATTGFMSGSKNSLAVDKTWERARKSPLEPSIFNAACHNPKLPVVQSFNHVSEKVGFQ